MKIIKSKTIFISPKATSAGTQYYDMDADDSAYLYKWLFRLMADMNEYGAHDEEVKREWFKRRPGTYPKGKNGPNSHASILGGILSAKIQNLDKNLSEPQLDAVEAFMDMVSQFYSDEPNPPTSITFQKKLFEIEK